MDSFNLGASGITVSRILRNAAPARLYEEALRYEPDTAIASTGALVALSGKKTGRSPKDKRVVENEASVNDIWWGKRPSSPPGVPCRPLFGRESPEVEE